MTEPLMWIFILMVAAPNRFWNCINLWGSLRAGHGCGCRFGWKAPVDILNMTLHNTHRIGSGGYFPVDVDDVITMMDSHKWI